MLRDVTTRALGILTASKRFAARFAARPRRCSTRHNLGIFAARALLHAGLWTFRTVSFVADLLATVRAAREQLVAPFAARPVLVAAPLHHCFLPAVARGVLDGVGARRTTAWVAQHNASVAFACDGIINIERTSA